jgi:2-keto-3-deoxy-L-rhamnonate aldolase RhmA
MRGSELREALRSGRRVYGTHIVSPSPVWVRAIRQSGIDFVFIDTEHCPLDRTLLSWMCGIYREAGVAPVVRIPSPDPYAASQVLDGGAVGVIAPYIETGEQVRDLVGATKLRPIKGERLTKALRDANTLEPELKDYIDKRNADVVLIVNVESVPAIEGLDAILAVPELDAVLIGPHDLSCSLGIAEQYRDPRFDKAVQKIIRRARAKGIGAGIHFSEGIDLEIQWARAGANLILHGADITLFGRALRSDIAEIRHALGDDVVRTNG